MEYQFIDLLSINWIEKSYKLCNYLALHDVQLLQRLSAVIGVSMPCGIGVKWRGSESLSNDEEEIFCLASLYYNNCEITRHNALERWEYMRLYHSKEAFRHISIEEWREGNSFAEVQF